MRFYFVAAIAVPRTSVQIKSPRRVRGSHSICDPDDFPVVLGSADETALRSAMRRLPSRETGAAIIFVCVAPY
jgi:hypothetical protein